MSTTAPGTLWLAMASATAASIAVSDRTPGSTAAGEGAFAEVDADAASADALEVEDGAGLDATGAGPRAALHIASASARAPIAGVNRRQARIRIDSCYASGRRRATPRTTHRPERARLIATKCLMSLAYRS
jgi:hypothetical protein